MAHSDQQAPSLRSFADDYRRVRLAEGHASTDPEFVRRLPFRDITGRHGASWRTRAFHYLAIRLGLALVRAHAPGAVRVLDLGAGNGWMARRLAGSFRVTALDVDAGDTGLGALRDAPRRARRRRSRGAAPARAAASTRWSRPRRFTMRSTCARSWRRRRASCGPGGVLIVADSPVYDDDDAREAAWQRTRAHYASFGAAHLAARYRGLTRAELDAAGLFRFVTVVPGMMSWRSVLRGWRRPRADARLPVLFGWRR